MLEGLREIYCYLYPYSLVKIIKQVDHVFVMKGAQFIKTNEPLVINDVEKPKPEGNQVLLRVAATGVSHSDLHLYPAMKYLVQ